MAETRLAVIGLGNCASALIQGIHYYRERKPTEAIGLMHHSLGGYTPGDIEVVAAFDIDARKVNRDIAEAAFAPPNCTRAFQPELPKSGVRVGMGRILDGVSEHLADYPPQRRFEPADRPQPDRDEIVAILHESRAEIVVNYLPVGSEQAVKFYAECALEAGCGFVNCIPVFIASDPAWATRFAERGLPVIGDDIKSQLGATITHRALADLFHKRGVKLDRTYQLNTGGNTDF